MTTPTPETTVCLAVYEHKHGDDLSVHRTFAGAEAHLRTVARENLEGWGEDIAKYGDNIASWNEVVRSWHDIAGMTEFMRIEVLTLHE